MGDRKIVIVGASLAGISAADTLREKGFTGRIVVIGDEQHLPYDRPPLSKEALLDPDYRRNGGRALRPSYHYKDYGIDLRTGQRATGLDPVRKEVVTTKGVEPYDTLIVATGCRARNLPMANGQSVPVLRTIDDAVQLIGRLDHMASIALIGSGFISLEVAAALARQGIKVTVIGANKVPLDNIVGQEIGRHIQELHEANGVRFINGVTVSGIEPVSGGYSVRLPGQADILADYALAGIGTIANTDWLASSGLRLSNGIVCDASGRTSVTDVWAAGDVAAYASIHGPTRVEHWSNAVEQGRHVALNILAGRNDPFRTVPYAWSDQFDRKFQTLGRREQGDTTEIVEGSLEQGHFIATHRSGDRLTAITACGMTDRLRPYRRTLQASPFWADTSFAD